MIQEAGPIGRRGIVLDMTDETTNEWVVYQPSKSAAFGHQSRIRDPRRAWPAVQQFMAGLTRSALSRRITLKINSERYIDRDVAARRIQQALELFGRADDQLEANPSDPGWTLSEAQ